jgi:hypothetical protein
MVHPNGYREYEENIALLPIYLKQKEPFFLENSLRFKNKFNYDILSLEGFK